MRRRFPGTPFTVQKMDSESYNPRGDLRGCVGARLVPLGEITNADMTGVMVGVAGES